MTTETVLEPEIAICDPHHHLYGPGSMFSGPYSIADLRADIGDHRVTRTVYVETQSMYRTSGSVHHLAPVGETEWVRSQCDEDGLVQAIVGFADLMLGDAVDEVLEAHVDAARGLFRGVRFRDSNFNQPPPPGDWLTNPAFRAGVEALRRRGLILEIFVLYPDLADVAALARACPDIPIVLDHIGTPVPPALNPRPHAEATRDEMLQRWRRDVEEIAGCENVVVKIGGIGMHMVTDPADVGGQVTSETIARFWGPDLLRIIDLFGPDRSMFESNFPIDAALCDYGTLWNVYKRVSQGYSSAERAQLFEGTAARVYGLPETAAG